MEASVKALVIIYKALKSTVTFTISPREVNLNLVKYSKRSTYVCCCLSSEVCMKLDKYHPAFPRHLSGERITE